MIAFFAFMGLALFWVVLIWLVKRDQGWVGLTDSRRIMIAFTGRMVLLADQIANAFLPAIRKATEAMIEWNKSVAKMASVWHLVGDPEEPQFENDWGNVRRDG
jgi:hypothetical protein